VKQTICRTISAALLLAAVNPSLSAIAGGDLRTEEQQASTALTSADSGLINFFNDSVLCAGAAAPLEAREHPMLPLTNSVSTEEFNLGSEKASIWEHGIGEGFRSTTHSFGLSAGATYGFSSFGSVQAHDLALITLSYGHMLSHVWGEGHWYRGNLEFRLELFTGAQFSPSREWLVGLTPHLRYDFATGTRWIPFVDGGAGVTATSIGPPDLSGTFEFNLQAGAGVQWFVKTTWPSAWRPVMSIGPALESATRTSV
jgi:hypothetical protein